MSNLVNSYAHFEANEASASTVEATVALARNCSKHIIMNDDGTNNILFRFRSDQTQGTILPNESVELEYNTKEILIDASAGTPPYRIWSFG